MARPTDYSQDLADRICEQLADGKSLRTVCLADDMPDKRSVFRWLRIHEEFSHQYARAKEESADALSDEMLDIADDGSNDWMASSDGGQDYNGDHVQRARLRIDTRKWIASKLKPKKYGDKLEVGGDPSNPIKHAVEVHIVDHRPDKG